MIALGYFLIAIGTVLDSVITIVMFLLIARAILSWVSPDPSNMLVQFIYSTTEPIIRPVRNKIPPMGMLDLSFLVVFLGCYFLKIFLVQSLIHYGRTFVPAAGL